jgi:tetratricopeptide (TPR) repeat protein
VRDLSLPCDLSRPGLAESELRVQLGATPPEGHRDPRSLEILTQIARAQALQGALSTSETTLARVARLLPEEGRSVARIRYWMELGRVVTMKHEPARAKPLFLQAWNAARETGETFLAIDAAQMLAVIEAPKLRPEWIRQGLAIALQSDEPRVVRWRGVLHLSLGAHLFDTLQYAEALAEFENAERCLTESGDREEALVARCSAAKVLRALGRNDDALQVLRELLAARRAEKRENGFLYEELAETLFALGQREEARQYFELAHGILSKDEWLNDDQPARINRLHRLSKPKP